MNEAIDEALAERENERAETRDDGGQDDEAGEPVPEAVGRALVPEADTAAAPEDDAERFDITAPELEAQQFFSALVDGTEYNVAVHPDVEGTISLTLRDVTVPQVMRTVRQIYGYEYQETDAGYLVLPREPQTRIYRLDYLNVDRTGTSNTRVSSGGLTGSDGDGGSGGSGSGIETASSSNVWEEVVTALEAIIGDSDQARIGISPQAGSLVVRAMPSTLRKVEEFIGGVEENLARQVVLEAKILEVRLDDGFQAGIQWDAAFTPNNDNIQFQQGSNVLQGAAPDPGGVFSLSANVGDFGTLVDLLETQGDVRVLSSPRVSTVNNQKAVIKVGTDDFFVTDITTESDSGGSNDSSDTRVSGIELDPFFSGIALDVTPHISEDREVTLHVHPTVSEVTDQRKEIDTGQGSFSVPLASSDVRESDSIVRADSGNVIVIGGLMQDRVEETTGQVPFLGDLPGVGGLFRQQEDETRKSELVILLRPVVVGPDTWQQELEGARGRIQRLNPDAGGAPSSSQ